MERWVSVLIIIMMSLLTIGGFATLLTGLTFRHKRHMKEIGSADVNALRDELAQHKDDSSAQIAELHERLDFAERLLAQQRDPRLPPAPEPPARRTPRPTTPV